MGRISNFQGGMEMQISFLLSGKAYKASMLRERCNPNPDGDVEGGPKPTEKIIIKLEEAERSIVLQSFTEGGGQPAYLTSGVGVEEGLIIQFGQQWMKSTTNALQDKTEEDDPSQPLVVPDLSTFFTSTYTFLNGDM